MLKTPHHLLLYIINQKKTHLIKHVYNKTVMKADRNVLLITAYEHVGLLVYQQ